MTHPEIKNNPIPPTIAGFSPKMLALIRQAQALNRGCIYIIYVAIAVFLLFGTLQSLASFKANLFIYNCFHYLPYLLIGVTIPCTLYVTFILYRYRLSQPSMLALCLAVGVGLFILSGVIPFITWIAFTAWIGMAFLFRANLNRFFEFIAEHSTF